MRILPTLAILILAIPAPAPAADPAPADALLKLVPPDAGAVFVVEDLRGHARSFLDSPLAEGLLRVPSIRDWRNSEGSRRLDLARKDIEGALGVDLKTVRDELLGDAFLLAIHAEAGADPREPRGLLVARSRNRALLDQLIGVFNTAEQAGGDLAEVAAREHKGLGTYYHRRFREGTKADNWYAIVGEATFAWSNSEPLIQGLIERAAGRIPGLDSRPEVRKVRAGLPNGALASVLVDPRFLGRLVDTDPPTRRTPRRVRAYLDAVRYFGAAIEWRGGLLAAHLHASYEPSKLPEPHRRWAAGKFSGPARPMPAGALTFASIPVDFGALGDLIFDPAPGESGARLANTLTAVNGLLGRDLRREILPRVRPELSFVVRDPGKAKGALPIALRVGLDDEGGKLGVAKAIDNACRTVLALVALGPPRADLGGVVESTEVRGARLSTLSGPSPAFSAAVGPAQFVLGSSPQVVSWMLAPEAGAPASPYHPGFERARAEYFPDAIGYAFADLDAWVAWATDRRPAIVSRLARGVAGSEASGGRDLDNTIALGKLFRSAFATGSVAPGFEEAHLRLGLIVKGVKPEN